MPYPNTGTKWNYYWTETTLISEDKVGWISFNSPCFISHAVLRIRDVYPGSEFFLSRIPDPKFFRSGFKYLNPKKWSLNSRKYDQGCSSWLLTHPGSRIQGSKRHRIPDPDPQHCSYVSVRWREIVFLLFFLHVPMYVRQPYQCQLRYYAGLVSYVGNMYLLFTVTNWRLSAIIYSLILTFQLRLGVKWEELRNFLAKKNILTRLSVMLS
jgi:hypothetical protein